MEDIEELQEISTRIAQANLNLPDPALYDYYSDLNKRIYWLQGEIVSADDSLIKYIMRCNIEDYGKDPSDRKPIIILINCAGGSVDVMQSVIGAMSASKTPVCTVNICDCSSAAAMILANGHKGYRFALPFTTAMFHAGYMSVGGTVSQVDSVKKYYDAADKRITDFTFSRTNFTQKIKNSMKKDDIYFNELEQLSYGVVDYIVNDLDEMFEKIGLVKTGGDENVEKHEEN